MRREEEVDVDTVVVNIWFLTLLAYLDSVVARRGDPRKES